MIINKIRLQEEFPMTGVSDSWPLPVCDLNLNSTSGENGYMVKQVEGLEPPELDEVVEGFDINGEPSLTDVAEKRVLVFKIGLQPTINQSYGDLRDELYKLMSRTILIKLMYDSSVLAQTIGYIRRIETVKFSNKPEVHITIQCKYGPFFAPKAINIPLSTLAIANPIINYSEGTAPTGLDLEFTVTANTASFSISNHGRVRSLSSNPISNLFEITYPLLIDDVVAIHTHPQDKHVHLTRASVEYDIAGYLNAGAVWPALYPGVNTFTWTLESSWLEWISASYTPKFWGV